jgi:hypothetical protein
MCLGLLPLSVPRCVSLPFEEDWPVPYVLRDGAQGDTFYAAFSLATLCRKIGGTPLCSAGWVAWDLKYGMQALHRLSIQSQSRLTLAARPTEAPWTRPLTRRPSARGCVPATARSAPMPMSYTRPESRPTTETAVWLVGASPRADVAPWRGSELPPAGMTGRGSCNQHRLHRLPGRIEKSLAGPPAGTLLR